MIYGSRDKKGWARQKHIFQYFKEYFKYQSSLDLKEFFTTCSFCIAPLYWNSQTERKNRPVAFLQLVNVFNNTPHSRDARFLNLYTTR